MASQYNCEIFKGRETMTTTKSRTDAVSNVEVVLERNPGLPLDMGWVGRAHINRSAIERRIRVLAARRVLQDEWQVAWLLRAITCIDLTALSGDDTPGNVRHLC